MAIIENRATEIGDVIYIQTSVPIIGLIALTGFVDQVQSETAARYFYKEFRYSTDSINWSSWRELTIPNVATVSVEPINTFFIEYKYHRVGTDTAGSIEWNNIDLQAEVMNPQCGPIFDQSVFAQLIYCHQIDVIQWCVNVLEKVYAKGIIPRYIIRGESANALNIDEDYLTFWKTVCCYFALFVIYARQFENIAANTALLLEYVLERGILLCSNADTATLNHFREKYYDEIRKRGTILIAKPAGYASNVVNGELLRLICWENTEDFIFALLEPQCFGWNVGNHSPMYKGLENVSMMVKAYEQSQDVVDLANYGLYNDAYCSIVADGDKEVLRIAGVPVGEYAGIDTKAFYCHNYIDYEISFLIKQVDLAQNLTVKIEAISSNGSTILLQQFPTGAYNSIFCERIQMNRNDIYYQIRFFIYSLYTLNSAESRTNIQQGKHLMNKHNVVQLRPKIYLDNTLGTAPSGEIRLWDIKLRPLRTPGQESLTSARPSIHKRAYSLGFIHSNNMIEMYAINNNTLRSNAEVERLIREYLIPYNATIHHVWLPKDKPKIFNQLR